MTAYLNKKWKEGKLENGNYYTICVVGWSNQTFPCIAYCERNCFSANVIDILAKVPSYQEFMNLKRKAKGYK